MKTYELSLSRNYVSTWTVRDAIREILQNAIDSETEGNKMTVEHCDNVLTITNDGASISSSTLVLGCGNKTDDNTKIGGFSEGYKLALLVLLRNEYGVTIINNNCEWLPCFGHSKTFNTEVLKIKTNTISATNKLSFVISGITNDQYNSFKEYFPCIEKEYGETINTSVGDVLLDVQFKGKMFVNGLYIQEDKEFRYGYNFSTESVSLDRDRKAINYYQLRQLTAKALISSKECPMDVFNAICNSVTDTKDIIDVLEDATNDFLFQYKKIYFEKYKLAEGTIVATKQMCKLLKQDGYENVFEGTELESFLIAKWENNLSMLKNYKEQTHKLNHIVDAWEKFQASEYRELLMWFNEISSKLNNDEISFFTEHYIESSTELNPPYYGQIRKQVYDDFPRSSQNEYVENAIDLLVNEDY